VAGSPIGGDFVTFWCAPRLAQTRGAASIYDVEQLHQLEQQEIGSEFDAYAWFYPPTFLLLAWPLSQLPYLLALACWSLAGVMAFLFTAKRLAPGLLVVWIALAFPGVFANLLTGQNGLFTASLLGMGLVLLETAPIQAGVALGLLSFKPHLVALTLLVLAAGRHGRALGAALLTSGILIILSVACFGTEVWIRFLEQPKGAWELLEAGRLPFPRMITFYTGVRLLGGTAGLAKFVQGAVVTLVLPLVLWVWSGERRFPQRVSALVLGTLLLTPFAYDYDLALLAIPLAFGLQSPALFGGRILTGALFLLPVLVAPLAYKVGIPLAPGVLLLSFLILIREEAP
jgi:hypothetical protein